MAVLTIPVPDQFLPPLDELVAQTGAGTRERWAKNVLANILIDFQLRKDFGPQMEQRTKQLWSFWA